MEVIVLVLPLLRSFLIALPVFYVIYKWHTKRSPFIKKVDKIPGPKTLPFFGNALEYYATPAEIFNRFYVDLRNWGPVFRFWLLNNPQVLIQRARDVEKILQNMKYHVKSENYKFLHDWLGVGLLISRDEKWRSHRKMLTPAFHFNILHEFLPIFNKHALQMTKCLAAEPRASHPLGFDIFHYSSLCALDIICESSMGIVLNAQMNENSSYVHSVESLGELLFKRYFTPWLRLDFFFKLSPTKKEMDKHLKIINDFTDKVIAERREYLKASKKTKIDTDLNDFGSRRNLAFMDLLLAVEEEGLENMTHKDIRDHVSTFMFAGHDTVSTAVGWALFLLGINPEHQDRIVEELVEVFGDSGRAPDMSDLANLKYLERCMKESFRLYPSISFIERGLEHDVELDNYTIPAGCTVIFNIFMLHRDPEFWPEPEKFDPDRFLPENIKGRHPYAFIPFSAGPRNCIGQKYALMEEKVLLSTILRRFRVEAAHSLEEAEMTVRMVLRPQNGLKIRLYERDSHPNLRVSS